MKKINYIVLVFVMCFIYTKPIFALNFDFKVQADSKEIVKGNETTVKVLIKSYETEGISTCRFKTDIGNGLEFVSKNGVNNWSMKEQSENNPIYLLESNSELGLTSDNSGEGVAILEIKYKVNNNATLKFVNIECANATNDFTHTDVSIDFTTKEVTADYTLSNLEITGGRIITEGGFTTANKSYVAEIDGDTFGIVATASNPDYQNKIVITNIENGEPLNANSITFKPNGESMMLLIAVNESTDVYNLMVRKSATSNEGEIKDNTLKSLTVGGKNLELSSCLKEGNIYNCSITLDSKMDSYAVNAVLNDSNNFKFDEANGGTGNYTGSSFLIIIKPKDSSLGIADLQYVVNVSMPGGGTNKPSSSSSNSPSSSKNNITQNPQTGNIASFVMAIVLMFSLVASVLLYKKNMESYK